MPFPFPFGAIPCRKSAFVGSCCCCQSLQRGAAGDRTSKFRGKGTPTPSFPRQIRFESARARATRKNDGGGEHDGAPFVPPLSTSVLDKMANPRQRRKSRSGTAKVKLSKGTRKSKNKVVVKGPAVLQANWDRQCAAF